MLGEIHLKKISINSFKITGKLEENLCAGNTLMGPSMSVLRFLSFSFLKVSSHMKSKPSGNVAVAGLALTARHVAAVRQPAQA